MTEQYTPKTTFNPRNMTCIEIVETSLKIQVNSTELLYLSELFKECIGEDKNQNIHETEKIMSIMHLFKNQTDSLKRPEKFNFAKNLFEVFNYSIEGGIEWEHLTEYNDTSYGSFIMDYANELGDKCLEDSSEEIETKNIIVKVNKLTGQSEIKFNGSNMKIILPRNFSKQYNGEYLVFIIFKNLGSHLKVNRKYLQVYSDIISITMINHTSINLDDEFISIYFENAEQLEFGDKIECDFWNFSTPSWSSEGCHYRILLSNRKISVCQCNHFTNFAILLDTSGREGNSKIKSILTDVVCGISMVCYIIIICLFLFIRELRNRRATLLCNLCFCLLVVDSLVVFGLERTEYPVTIDNFFVIFENQ